MPLFSLSFDSGHPAIVNRWLSGQSCRWLPACRIDMLNGYVCNVSRCLWDSRSFDLVLGGCCTTSVFSSIVDRRVIVRTTQACQTTRVQSRLVEVLGRFISSIYIRWWRPAKPNVTQLFETPSYWADLLLRRLHVKVQLWRLPACQLWVHSRLRAWHFWLSEGASAFDGVTSFIRFHIDESPRFQGARLLHALLAQHPTSRRVIGTSSIATYGSTASELRWVKIRIRADRLCGLEPSGINLTITRLHDLVHKFASVMACISRPALALRHRKSRSKNVIRLIEFAASFSALSSCMHEI